MSFSNKKSDTIVFFDLEETVIDEFSFSRIVNKRKVSKAIASYKGSTFGIFSFAVYVDQDRETVKDSIIPLLEDNFDDLKFDKSFIPTIQDIVSAIRKEKNFTKQTFSDFEVFQFFSKQEAFLMFVKQMIKNESPFKRFVLFDDMVDDSCIVNVGDAIIEIYNIDKVM